MVLVVLLEVLVFLPVVLVVLFVSLFGVTVVFWYASVFLVVVLVCSARGCGQPKKKTAATPSHGLSSLHPATDS